MAHVTFHLGFQYDILADTIENFSSTAEWKRSIDDKFFFSKIKYQSIARFHCTNKNTGKWPAFEATPNMGINWWFIT